MRNIRLAFCLCLNLLVFGGDVSADGVIRDGMGARVIGRGGTNLGFADNAALLIDNPAGIGNGRLRGRLELGGALLFPSLKYGDADNLFASGSGSPFPVGEIGLFHSLTPRTTIGLGLLSHAGFSTKQDLVGPQPFAGLNTYKSIGALARVLAGVSHRFTPRLSAGVSFGVAVSHLELEGPYFLQGPHAFRGTPVFLDLQATGAAPSFSAGLQYRLTERTTLGIGYTEETGFDLDGNTVANIPGLGSGRFDSRLDITWPRFLGIGLKHDVCRCQSLAVDLIWFDWSSAFDRMSLSLANPDNAAVAGVVGNSLLETFPLEWRDTMSLRLGWQGHVNQSDTLRLGYVYHRNPIPSSTLTPFIPAILEHAFSAGVGTHIGRWNWDFAYQYSFGRNQSVGQSAFVGGDFNQSINGASVHWAALSAGLDW